MLYGRTCFISLTCDGLCLLVQNPQGSPLPRPFLATTDLASLLWVCFSFVDKFICVLFWDFPGGTHGKEPACQCPCGRRKRCRFDPWVRKILWRRKGQPAPVLLPGESRGQRSLVGYSSWGHKESDTTEVPSAHASLCMWVCFVS